MSAGAIAFGSLPAMMSASGFDCTAALMIETCVEAPASVGPEMRFDPPSSSIPSVDAGVLELLVRVAELLRDRDRLEALLELGVRIGAGRLGFDELDELLDSSSCVEPHAETASSAARASTANSTRETDGIDHFGPSSGC